MRIGYGSDWHIEFEPRWREMLSIGPDGHPRVGPNLMGIKGIVDVMVLAGDIAPGPAARDYAHMVARFLDVPVIQVAGNHEFYHHDLDTVVADFRDRQGQPGPPVLFLENDLAEIAGMKFAGCTLWTDFEAEGNRDANLRRAANDMNDYVAIKRNNRRLRPIDTLAMHHDSRAWLNAVFAVDGGADIVITHHAPSLNSIHSESRRAGTMPMYASNLDNQIIRWAPKLWIHGHTHEDVDYMIGETRIAAKQRGYMTLKSRSNNYVPGIIEI
tara:strand:- start:6582 stop:7391 length:810 start_codon:yes stop_codon:yes gene_type:complete